MSGHPPTDPRSRRILWLLNHATLRTFEAQLLADLGFEVFTPKIFRDAPESRSASVDYRWDSTLSIPEDDLAELNRFNFYDGLLTPRLRAILNRHFGVAIVAYFPNLLDEFLQGFAGIIVLRAFGLTAPEWSYFSFMEGRRKPGFRARLMAAIDRFWFAGAYPNLAEIEPAFVRDRAVTLPVGLPEQIWARSGSWTGAEKKLFFVCPDINVFEGTAVTYRRFKEYFGDFPHCIAGAQSAPVSDPNVLGFLPREEFEDRMRSCAVMFYHGELPRHLHYHPIEAVCFGVPLIYMRKGMLGELGGRDLPGACDSYGEARAKVRRVLAGDRSFVEELRGSQKALLDYFRTDRIAARWKEDFIGKIVPHIPSAVHPRRIAVLVGDRQTPFVAKYAAQLADAIERGAREDGCSVEVVLGMSRSEAEAVREADLLGGGAAIRPAGWTYLAAEQVEAAQEFTGYRGRPWWWGSNRDAGCVPRDGSYDFQDCDFWILVANSQSTPIAPVRPYALALNDVSLSDTLSPDPQAGPASALIPAARAARFLLTATEELKGYAEQLLGLPEGFVIAAALPDRRARDVDRPQERRPAIFMPVCASDQARLDWIARAVHLARHSFAEQIEFCLALYGSRELSLDRFHHFESLHDPSFKAEERACAFPALRTTVLRVADELEASALMPTCAALALTQQLPNAHDFCRIARQRHMTVLLPSQARFRALDQELSLGARFFRAHSVDDFAQQARTSLTGPGKAPQRDETASQDARAIWRRIREAL